MGKRRDRSIDDRLRDAIRASGRTKASLARAAGVNPGNLCSFMFGMPMLGPKSIKALMDELERDGQSVVTPKPSMPVVTTETRKPTPHTDRLRAALNASGRSINSVAKAVGIDQSSLNKFSKGKIGIGYANGSRLSAYLGLDANRQPATRSEPEPEEIAIGRWI